MSSVSYNGRITDDGGDVLSNSTYIPPPPQSPLARGDKPKNLWFTIVRLLKYAKPIRWVFIVITIVGLLTTLLAIIGPQYLGDIADYAADSIESGGVVDPDKIIGTVLILIIIYSLLMFLEWTRFRMEWVYEEKLGNILRKELSRKVSKIPISQLDQMRMGDLMSRFVNDSDTIRLESVECITRLLESIILLVGCSVMMVITDWRLAIAVLIPVVLGFIMIKIIIEVSQKYFRAQSRNLGKMNTIVEETYRGLDVINVFNGLDDTKDKFGTVNKELVRASLMARLWGEILPSFMGFINNLGYVIVCIVASLFILDGSATFGTLVTFIVYVKLCNRPLMFLSNAFSGIQEVAAASERIFEFLDTPEMDDEDGKIGSLDHIDGRIVFDKVRFSYIPGTEVIHDLNLTVEPGMRIAIVGPTGAGKTTISNLLLRYYDPDSGSISLDGTRLTDIKRDVVREQFSVVLQDTWLFKGTVRQNLVFDSEEADDERIMDVCRAVGLGHYIDALPKGLDTYIEDPRVLSAGQRQQITIARAIIKDAPMLIMDEATSSIDTHTERAIQESMDHLMKGRTSFVIAHRLSTIKSADHIIVIRKGEIIERGTHEELISNGGFYRSLYDSQFEFCD